MKRIIVSLILIVLLINPVFSKQKFDLQLYELMYKSFIYTQDLEHAYIVAKKVLKVIPFSIKWRKRVAQLALWLGKTDEAYKNYLYIYNKTKDPSIEKILFTFSYPEIINLKIQKYETQVKKGNYQNALELAKLYEYTGYPEKSLKLLKQIYEKTNKKEYLYEYLIYATKLGETHILVKYIQTLKVFPLEKKYDIVYLLIAKGYYDKALEVLRYVQDLPKDKTYYNLLLFLLLKNQKYKEFIKVVKYLLIKQQIDISYIYPLLDYYYRKKDLQSLEFIYSKIYKIKKTKAFIKEYINILIENKKFQQALEILNENTSIFSDKEYLFYLAKIYAGLKNKEKVAKIYKILLKDYREQLSLNEKKEILWFFIDNSEEYYKLLKTYLPFFKKEKDLYIEVITAYMNIQELDKAYSLAKKYINKEKNNLSFLILYADILNIQTKFDESSYYYNKAWILANKQLRINPNIINNKEFLRNYIRLSFKYSSPKKIKKLLKIAKNTLNYNEYLNLILDYYLYLGEYDPSFYIYNYKRIF
ncbi:tetratricopeptide repeat protein [Hydrogenothermus marinus]|uniref:Tetratricopeptide repeat protein n=1 Tax=Hydrogenothermus marinus TaxID=133270 RepID=A0A3M0BMF2_9AQUI|nr:tetratricopeptide repeat protein [Hydrogenothermus marinus]RMA97664.1 tetratricopeptide repeat protein [Hydrogenothermus marinus]